MITPNQFVLWGSAGHAKVLADLVGLQGGKVIALFDNDFDATSSVSGAVLYHGEKGFREWLTLQKSLKNIGAALAIGGVRGKDRQELAQALIEAGLSLPMLIHPSAVVSESASIGMGSQVLANTVVAADSILGNLCIVNNSANIDHECILGNGVHIAPGAVLCGSVSVGGNSMVGAGAIVLPNTKIGENVLVGAGAVVTRDIPDGFIVSGNPARSKGDPND